MEDEESAPPPVAPAALGVPAVPVNNSVKLPAFWPAKTAAWFASVEGIFELRNITSQRARYFTVLAALPESTVVLIADLIESVPLPSNVSHSFSTFNHFLCSVFSTVGSFLPSFIFFLQSFYVQSFYVRSFSTCSRFLPPVILLSVIHGFGFSYSPQVLDSSLSP
jgi:hypothetical protein